MMQKMPYIIKTSEAAKSSETRLSGSGQIGPKAGQTSVLVRCKLGVFLKHFEERWWSITVALLSLLSVNPLLMPARRIPAASL